MLPVSDSESLARTPPSSTLPSPVHSRGDDSAVRSEASTFLGHLRVGTLVVNGNPDLRSCPDASVAF